MYNYLLSCLSMMICFSVVLSLNYYTHVLKEKVIFVLKLHRYPCVTMSSMFKYWKSKLNETKILVIRA